MKNLKTKDHSLPKATGRLLWLWLLCLISTGATYAQSISGPTSVSSGTTHDYYYSHPGGNTFVSWSVVGSPSGISVSGRGGSVRVTFGSSVSTGTYTLRVTDHANGSLLSPLITNYNVYVSNIPPAPPTPSTTISSNGSGCGSRTASYNGSPPSGVTWYWQNAAGTNLGTGSTSPAYTSSGYIYLRAYKASNPSSTRWSTSRLSYYITVNPISPKPDVTNNQATEGDTDVFYACPSGSVSLSASFLQTGSTQLRWYKGATLIAQNTSTVSVTAPASGSAHYEVKVYNTSTGCISPAQKIRVDAISVPSRAAYAMQIDGNGNTSTITPNVAGVTGYKWYQNSGKSGYLGTGTSWNIAPIFQNTVFYAIPYKTVSGVTCEGSEIAITVVPGTSLILGPDTYDLETGNGLSQVYTASYTIPSSFSAIWTVKDASGNNYPFSQHNDNAGVNIIWNQTGSFTITLASLSGVVASKTVTVTNKPNLPNATISFSSTGCFTGTLSFPESEAPKGQTSENVYWYWQTTATGTNTSTAHSSHTFAVSVAGAGDYTYYLRAFRSGRWSDAQAYTINFATPLLPPFIIGAHSYNSSTDVYDVYICDAGSIDLATIVSNTNPLVGGENRTGQIQWFEQGQTTPLSNLQTPVLAIGQSKIYEVANYDATRKCLGEKKTFRIKPEPRPQGGPFYRAIVGGSGSISVGIATTEYAWYDDAAQTNLLASTSLLGINNLNAINKTYYLKATRRENVGFGTAFECVGNSVVNVRNFAQPVIKVQPVYDTPHGVFSHFVFKIDNAVAYNDAKQPVSYQWFKDGVAIAGATQATYTPTQAGEYKVQVGVIHANDTDNVKGFGMSEGVNPYAIGTVQTPRLVLPNTSIATSNSGCGEMTLTLVDEIPKKYGNIGMSHYVMWYWQTDYTHTSLDHLAFSRDQNGEVMRGLPFVITQSGTYYLRAYDPVNKVWGSQYFTTPHYTINSDVMGKPIVIVADEYCAGSDVHVSVGNNTQYTVQWFRNEQVQDGVLKPNEEPFTTGDLLELSNIKDNTVYWARFRFKLSAGGASCASPLTKAQINIVNCSNSRLAYVRTSVVRVKEYTLPQGGNAQVKTADDVENLSVLKGEVVRSTTYMDGIGRGIQSISHQSSPAANDVVQFVEYDNLGRALTQYMPYTINNNLGTGAYRPNALAEQTEFYKAPANGEPAKNYATSAHAFTKVDVEDSPIGRVKKQYAPGQPWVGNNRGVSNEIRFANLTDIPELTSEQYTAGNTTAENIALTLNEVERTPALKTEYKAQQKVVLTDGFSVSDTDPGIGLEVTGTTQTHTNKGVYNPNHLIVTKVTDEDGKLTESYINAQGQVVMKRSLIHPGNNNTPTQWAETYNVYNEFGQLVTVYSPKAVEVLKANNWDVNAVRSQIDKLAYHYYYDVRGRLIRKDVPQGGQVEMVYDPLDRLVLSQDSKQRQNGRWDYVKYDVYNRTIESGVYNSTLTRAQLQADIDANFGESGTYKPYNRFDADATAGHLYTNEAFPTDAANTVVQSVNYFDNYRWQKTTNGINFNADLKYNTEFDALLNPDEPVIGLNISEEAFTKENEVVSDQRYLLIGAATGGKTAIVDGDGKIIVDNQTTQEKWQHATVYYDRWGKVLQTRSENHLGGVDATATHYKYDGQVTQTVAKHQRKVNGTDIENYYVAQWMTYDHMGRTKAAYHQISSTYAYKDVATASTDPAVERLSQTNYNELGQVIENKLGKNAAGQALQTVNYRYNIRGWLTHLNDADLSTKDTDNDLFGFELKYGDEAAYHHYNGNIGRMVWKSALDGVKRQYDYNYDGMDRLKIAIFTSAENEMYTVDGGPENNGIKYDVNGNILRLRRYGLADRDKYLKKTYGVIDDLHYSYDEGNQLVGVDDNEMANVTGVAKDFRDNHKYATHGQEYYYDINGNLMSDKNKNITSISYNDMNKPLVILFAGGESIEFSYDAAGTKLSKRTDDGQGNIRTTHYAAGFVYQNDALQFVGMAAGRVLYAPSIAGDQSGRTWLYEYHYTDHQGNLRMAFREGTKVSHTATLENTQADKQAGFEYDNAIRTANPSTAANTSAYVAKLNTSQPLGMLRNMQVSKGDVVTVKVQGYYTGSPNDNNAINWGVTLGNLTNSTGNSSTGEISSQNTPYLLSLGVGITPGSGNSLPSGVPNGYLKAIFYDKDGKPVATESQVQYLQNAAGQWQNLELSFTAQQNGYVQVYVANESDQEVYFDNLEVNHTPTLIAQENHYYPFGMNMVGIEKQGLMQNMFQYNGQTERETSFHLNWDETPFRRYDAQLGRFHGVDALASSFAGITPYQYAFNNPVMLNDPSGLMPSTTDKMLFNFLGHDEPNSKHANGLGGNLDKMFSKNQEEYYYYGKDGKYHNSKGFIVSSEEAIKFTIGRAIIMKNVFSVHPSSFGAVVGLFYALQESAGANAGGKEDKGGLDSEQEEESMGLSNDEGPRGVIFLQLEGRFAVGLLGYFGITASGAVGIAADRQGNVGIYTTISGGVSVLSAVGVGAAAGINFNADGIDAFEGWGVNAGAFGGAGLGNFAAELNTGLVTENDNFFKPKKDGHSMGGSVGVPNFGIAFGLSGYGDVSYTSFILKIRTNNMEMMVNKFDQTVKKKLGVSLKNLGISKKQITRFFITKMKLLKNK